MLLRKLADQQAHSIAQSVSILSAQYYPWNQTFFRCVVRGQICHFGIWTTGFRRRISKTKTFIELDQNTQRLAHVFSRFKKNSRSAIFKWLMHKIMVQIIVRHEVFAVRIG